MSEADPRPAGRSGGPRGRPSPRRVAGTEPVADADLTVEAVDLTDEAVDLTDQHRDQPDQPDQPDQQPDQPDQPDQQEPPDMTVILERPPVPVAARMLLDRSRTGLLQACAARSCGERYVAAHLAALRAAAAVLAVRGRPTSRGGPRSVWDVLPRVAPEMGEWSAFFAATATRRAAIEAGRGASVTARDADDLLRDAESFHHVVEDMLGLPHQPVLPVGLPSCL